MRWVLVTKSTEASATKEHESAEPLNAPDRAGVLITRGSGLSFARSIGQYIGYGTNQA